MFSFASRSLNQLAWLQDTAATSAGLRCLRHREFLQHCRSALQELPQAWKCRGTPCRHTWADRVDHLRCESSVCVMLHLPEAGTCTQRSAALGRLDRPWLLQGPWWMQLRHQSAVITDQAEPSRLRWLEDAKPGLLLLCEQM